MSFSLICKNSQWHTKYFITFNNYTSEILYYLLFCYQNSFLFFMLQIAILLLNPILVLSVCLIKITTYIPLDWQLHQQWLTDSNTLDLKIKQILYFYRSAENLFDSFTRFTFIVIGKQVKIPSYFYRTIN